MFVDWYKSQCPGVPRWSKVLCLGRGAPCCCWGWSAGESPAVVLGQGAARCPQRVVGGVETVDTSVSERGLTVTRCGFGVFC